MTVLIKFREESPLQNSNGVSKGAPMHRVDVCFVNDDETKHLAVPRSKKGVSKFNVVRDVLGRA